MYRLGGIEKRGFCYRSAELAAEIKKMKQLQEQYLFLCQNDIASVVDLIEINVQNKQRIDMISDRQHDIYVERANRKRKCKSVESLQEYQLWHMESQQELDQLKAEKNELNQQIRMGESCLKENLATAKYLVGESDELLYEAKDEIPDLGDLISVNEEQAETVEMDSFTKELNEAEEVKLSDVVNAVGEAEREEMSIQERVERIVKYIVESGKDYEKFSYREKAELFEFKLDDIADNMKLHGEVLAKLGIRYSGAEMFEDYQEIYDEMVKREERAGGTEESIASERREKEGRNR